ncbi:MAG: response regulator transcription factor [Mediterraneibacter sp.]
MTIAIAEDNTTTRRELSRLLTSHGYETVLPDDFKDLAGQLAGLSADLILLDVNLPYENGYDICRRIRELTRTPVIFVTSRDTSADELMSIRAGGIDFVSKPYDPLILLEKIRRALRLTDPGNFRELTRKGCTLDLHLSVIRYSGREAELTRNEFRILYYFFMNSGKVIGKEELLEKLWNDRFYLDENVLMVNMTRLKHKLREIGITHLLENIRGKGWKL